jgi:hypothetical protein
VGDAELGYVIAGAGIIGVAFAIFLVSFIDWLQHRDRSRP